jgi:hypothetical protein
MNANTVNPDDIRGGATDQAAGNAAGQRHGDGGEDSGYGSPDRTPASRPFRCPVIRSLAPADYGKGYAMSGIEPPGPIIVGPVSLWPEWLMGVEC